MSVCPQATALGLRAIFTDVDTLYLDNGVLPSPPRGCFWRGRHRRGARARCRVVSSVSPGVAQRVAALR